MNHDERLLSRETQAGAIEARLRAPEEAHQGGGEETQTDLKRSIADLTGEVALEPAAIHKMLATEGREWKVYAWRVCAPPMGNCET